MSCYVPGDKMREKDRIEERRSRTLKGKWKRRPGNTHILQNNHTHTYTHGIRSFLCTFKLTKVSAVTTSYNTVEGQSERMKGKRTRVRSKGLTREGLLLCVCVCVRWKRWREVTLRFERSLLMICTLHRADFWCVKRDMVGSFNLPDPNLCSTAGPTAAPPPFLYGNMNIDTTNTYAWDALMRLLKRREMKM